MNSLINIENGFIYLRKRDLIKKHFPFSKTFRFFETEPMKVGDVL